MSAPFNPAPVEPTATRGEQLRTLLGDARPPTDDPAWQPPTDPLDDDAFDVAGRSAQARVIRREVPLTVVATGWTVPAARRALDGLVAGMFDGGAQLWDSIVARDDRVRSALDGRLSLLGRPVQFKIPHKYRHDRAARECRRAFQDAWPSMATEPVMSELQRWAIGLGFGTAQILWDTTGDYAIPHPLVWHPRYVWYHFLYRCYVAITMDGMTPILPGDGHWILHAPAGEYRGWMRGAVGAIAPWWLAKHYALRDWSRWSERHGLPPIKFKHPAQRDPRQDASMASQLSRLGQEVVIDLPQHPVKELSYDVEWMEANAPEAAAGFDKLINRCDSVITLAIQSQNLAGGAEVTEGSYAAARVHAGVKQALLESDARALEWTIYQQLSRPFARMNGWPADMAPRILWDVTPYEDALTKAQALGAISTAIAQLRTAGVRVRDLRALVRAIVPGLDLGELEEVEPLQVAAGANSKAAVDAAKDQRKAAEKMGARARIASALRIGEPRSRIVTDEDEALLDALASQEAEDIRRGEKRKQRARWTW